MAPFKVVQHVIPGQHIREYPAATKRNQEDALQLVVNQYVPSEAVPNDAVTIIGVHGNAFPKETYEPLWEDLFAELRSRGVYVRGIWIADSSNQGASGVLNEDVMGDSVSWFDHSRDLLHMVNHFRDEMPRPIIGVAHSMGCAQLIHLAIMHPRLLSTVLLYEPVILNTSGGPHPGRMSTLRRDYWPTRAAAEASLRKVTGTWDPRAVDAYIEHGLRDGPTSLYPRDEKSGVTLTTSKHQEAWAYAQLNLEPKEAGLDRLLRPDWDPEQELPYRTARPECSVTMRNLPYLLPSALYVFGARSPLSPPEAQEEKVRETGIGVGGSGGAAEGRVEKAVLEKGGHLLAFEQVQQAAQVGADWIARWLERWREDEKILRAYQSTKSDDGMLRMSKAWVETTKLKVNTPRPRSEKL